MTIVVHTYMLIQLYQFQTAMQCAPVDDANKKIIFKNSATFTNCGRQIDNTQVDVAQDIDIVMAMHNLLEYSKAYSKTSGSLWQHYKNEPVLDNNNNNIDFPYDNKNSISFKFKRQIQTENGGTKYFEIMVSLKSQTNFWRTLEMSLINCEISFQSKWSKDCYQVAGTAANQAPEIKTTDTMLYVPVVTISIQDNIKLLKQLESDFKRTINWNKYQSKTVNQAQNRYLDTLIDPGFQGVYILFMLSYKDEDG